MANASNLVARYEPRFKLVIYKLHGRGEMHSEFYIEKHDYIHQPGSGQWKEGPGEPLERDHLMSLADAIRKKQGVKMRWKGLVPTNVLYVNPTKRSACLCWYVPAQKRQILTTADLRVKKGVAHVPPMIFLVSNDQLYVCALNRKKRPTLKSQLLYAPFWNVYEDGRVCLGTARIKMKNATYFEDIIKAYEKMFWESNFSHVAGTHCKVALPKLWNSLMNKRTKFPIRTLIQYKNTKTLETFLRRFQ